MCIRPLWIRFEVGRIDLSLVAVAATERLRIPPVSQLCKVLVVDVAGKGTASGDTRKRVGIMILDIPVAEDAEKVILGTDLVIDPQVERVLVVLVDRIKAKQIPEVG